jgi:hypothetical protein
LELLRRNRSIDGRPTAAYAAPDRPLWDARPRDGSRRIATDGGRMSIENNPRKLNIFARVLKRIGKQTDPKQTTTGKVFDDVEKKLTAAFEKLAQSKTYLNFAGAMMARGFELRAEATRNTEAVLRAMRLPTTSDFHAMRDQLRRVTDQNEALEQQLELVLDRLEKLQKENQKEKAS